MPEDHKSFESLVETTFNQPRRTLNMRQPGLGSDVTTDLVVEVSEILYKYDCSCCTSVIFEDTEGRRWVLTEGEGFIGRHDVRPGIKIRIKVRTALVLMHHTEAMIVKEVAT